MDFPLPEWPCSTTHSPLLTSSEALASTGMNAVLMVQDKGFAQVFNPYSGHSEYLILKDGRHQKLGIRVMRVVQHAVGQPTFHHFALFHHQHDRPA